jgi:hypothetical protein
MSRAIRRVPPDWEHPRNEEGRYKPLLDRDYEAAAEAWLAECIQWTKGEHPDQQSTYAAGVRYFWDWEGRPPSREYHRPKWESEPTAYQVYETVSEGTPISPVFPTRDALIDWLVNDGSGMGIGGTRQPMNRAAAERFAEAAWAPSMIDLGSGVESGLAIHEIGV